MNSIIDLYKSMFNEDVTTINQDCGGNFITIGELLSLSSMTTARLIGGSSGLDNKCTSIVVWETPDGLDWLIGGEFILTAGYAFKDSPEIKDKLIDKIHERGCSGIAIKEGRFLDDIPATMRERADQLGIPLVVLPKSKVYTELVSGFYEAIFFKSNAYLLETKKTHEKLLDLVFDKKDVNGVLEALGHLGNLSIVLAGPDQLIHNSFLRHNIIHPLVRETDLETAFHEDNFNRIKIPVEFDDNQTGAIYAFSLSPFNNLIRHMLSHGAKIIGMNMKKVDLDIFNEIRIKKMITSLIIQDKDLTDDFMKNVTANIKWDNKRLSYGIGLKFYAEKSQMPNAEIIQRDLNTLLKIYDKNMTFLIGESNDIFLIFINNISQSRLYELIDLLRFKFSIQNSNLSLSVNLSNPFQNLADLIKVQDECVVTTLINKPGETLAYESIGTLRLINPLKDDPTVVKQYNEIMLKIEDYDRQNEGVLLDTLIQYFNHNMNKKETSEELHIHVETLRYRLNKIQALTGCSTSSSEGLFTLQLMMKLKNIM